ncbi:Protein C2-DOMAIN ABA-RELATED 4 [Linum perenne]
MLGLLRLRIRRGRNLIVRDLGRDSSDPYVIVTFGSQASTLLTFFPCAFVSFVHTTGPLMQKLKSRTEKNTCNPEWKEELTLSVKNPNLPIQLTVYDHDTLSTDDKMGEVSIDLKPYVEAHRIGAKNLPNGCCLKIVQPTEHNFLADESRITWHDGRLLQDMTLKLQHVKSGEIDVQIEWLDVPGCKGLISHDGEVNVME